MKEEFKVFVKKNPNLIKYVRDGKKTWQNFYEIYNLYGEDDGAWKEYLTDSVVAGAAGASVGAVTDFFSWLKTIDLDSIQNGVSSIQRVIGVVQDLSGKDSKETKEEYKPRPLYKHFED